MHLVHKYFAEIILPLPLERNFTYAITEAESEFIKPGFRVCVPFGSNKIYTGIVLRLHDKPPMSYNVKSIQSILDQSSTVTLNQLKFWKWISEYYMCSIGEVMSAALPSSFILKMESIISINNDFDINKIKLTDDQYLVIEALQFKNSLTIREIESILNKKNIFSILNPLINLNVLYNTQNLVEKYKPKLVRCVKLTSSYKSKKSQEKINTELSRSKKLKSIISTYLVLSNVQQIVKVSDIKENCSGTSAQIKNLIEKGYFEEYFVEIEKIIEQKNERLVNFQLTQDQNQALKKIEDVLSKKSVCLLHGVTSSGKTEIYIKKIEDVISLNNQVLFLVPEIALTSQLVNRLNLYFGSKVIVYHSRFSSNERIDIWKKVKSGSQSAQIIVGPRSSLFLPFKNLKLIIVDEEHEPSYKQTEPSPRYHARDAAIMLASFLGAKVILGSATPSVESYFNACKNKKYGYVSLNKRYKNIILPTIELVDLRDKFKRKRMKGHFSDLLILKINETLMAGKQIILFQNRRGYTPVLSCNSCGYIPKCINCDVSLTYHQNKKNLKCHYCGYNIDMCGQCIDCGSDDLDYKGFGTEQVQEEAKNLFPTANVARMDFDTTRGKYSFDKIIESFQKREIDILVGTQMLTKGLDFGNVKLVGVLNADQLINFPDFRSHERSFQLLLQVAGRSGRKGTRGHVIIQTFNTDQEILQQVSNNDYKSMFNDQSSQRILYKYPPHFKLIKVILKHSDFDKVKQGSEWLNIALKRVFGAKYVLGPESPSIPRVRGLYIKNFLLKIPNNFSLRKTKKSLLKLRSTFRSVRGFGSIRLIIDVDSY